MNFKSVKLFLLLNLLNFGIMAQKPTLYLIAGQGSDGRVFKNLTIEHFDTVIIDYIVPTRNESMEDYAKRLATEIDTTKSFSLLGVSLGGMLAVEISKFTNPKHIIIVSSAKCRDELPFRYRFMKRIRLYKLFPGRVLKSLALVARPLFEPDSRLEHETCKAMTKDKNPKFMQRSIHCIVNWKGEDYRSDIIHIHGDNDHTLLIENIRNPILVKGGSHMMVLTRGKEISGIINGLFLSK